ncbi:MAG: sugar porter family MFS transporter [Candidatus Omnitrophica bacterium]|nr:sugar porter family MFS transporter [Candidatus Omnitrophota bacterium]
MNSSTDHVVSAEPSDGGSVVYVYLLSFVAALGGLLFGYDTAVISGAIGFLSSLFELNEYWQGWTASSALVGCIVGAACAGWISDRLGRKTALLFSAVLFTASAIGSAIPRSLSELIVARIVGGVGVGVASMLSPLYIAETAPARIRGRLVTLNQFAIVFGMLVVYFVNAKVAAVGDEAWNIKLGWRWMFASETLPALLFFVLLFFVPESPRWLTKQGRREEALAILTRVGGRSSAAASMQEIQYAIAHEGGSIRQLLKPGLRMAMMIGIGLAVLQQITGINVVLYYAPEIFKSAGMTFTKAINDTVIIGAVNLLFTLIAFWLVDKLGRKILLLLASFGMGVSLFLLGLSFIIIPLGEYKLFSINLGFMNFDVTCMLFFVLAYVASFATAMGPVVWVVMSEIFPTRIRGRAMSIATVCLWISCYAVSQFFPQMLKMLGGFVFFVYALMCVAAFLFFLIFVPETKGKTLEEIEKRWLPMGRTD